MTRANFLICVAIAVISISFWALFNRPENEPPWPSRIQGFSFSPMQAHNNRLLKNFPTEEEIDAGPEFGEWGKWCDDFPQILSKESAKHGRRQT